MSANEYKPIRLTQGKAIDYASLMQQTQLNKDVQAKAGGPSAELARLGIKGETKVTYKRDANGNLLLDKNGKPIVVTQFTPTEVPEWFTHAIMVLSGMEPCYFEGCDEVLAKYNEELKVLEARPGGCRECDRAKLRRKYATVFRNALPPNEANRIAQPTIPPHTVKNLATNEVTHVPRKTVPYGTIRREIPQALRDAFTKSPKERKLIVNGQEIPIDALQSHPTYPGVTLGPGTESTGGDQPARDVLRKAPANYPEVHAVKPRPPETRQ